jgi:DNA-binding transcriptional ArsR family regulator
MGISFKDLEIILKGVANKRRLIILDFLNKTGEKDTGSIADYLKTDYKIVVPHLEKLVKANLVVRRREGLIVHYQISDLGKKILNLLKHFTT